MIGGEKCGEGEEQLRNQSTSSCVQHVGGIVIALARMAADGKGSLVYIDGKEMDLCHCPNTPNSILYWWIYVFTSGENSLKLYFL